MPKGRIVTGNYLGIFCRLRARYDLANPRRERRREGWRTWFDMRPRMTAEAEAEAEAATSTDELPRWQSTFVALMPNMEICLSDRPALLCDEQGKKTYQLRHDANIFFNVFLDQAVSFLFGAQMATQDRKIVPRFTFPWPRSPSTL